MHLQKRIKKTLESLNLNNTKRPISVVADNVEVRNAKKIQVKVNKKI